MPPEVKPKYKTRKFCDSPQHSIVLLDQPKNDRSAAIGAGLRGCGCILSILLRRTTQG